MALDELQDQHPSGIEPVDDPVGVDEHLADVGLAVLGDHAARSRERADAPGAVGESDHPAIGGVRIIAGDVLGDVLEIEHGVR